MQKSNECGWLKAGVTDIAYVKDLLTDTVVNHNFSCSNFGYGYHSVQKFGWVNI